MSASSRPTVAPESRSAAARFTATVDLPTPPLPEAMAMVCLAPGTAWSRAEPLNGERTLAVILRSTAVTPGMAPTRSRASVWNRSRTGQAGVVSSKVNFTRPSWPIWRSLIMPRLTTSRCRSGSSIAARAASTCSVLGGAAWLLGTEDHARSQRQHTDQDEQGDEDDVRTGTEHGRGAAGRFDASRSPRRHQAGGDTDRGQDPQGQERQRPAGDAGKPDRDEEDDEQDQLEDREVAGRRVQSQKGVGRVRPVAGHPGDQRGRAAEAGGEEQAAKRPGVTPHRLVAHAQEHSGVGREEQRQHGPDDVEKQSQRAAERPGVGATAVQQKGLERRDRGEQAEDEEGPRADRHRRPVLEAQALVAGRDVDQHVPEAHPPGPEVDGQQHRADEDGDEADVEADAGGGLVSRVTGQAQESRDRVRATAQAGEEEVAEDEPRPLGSADEMLGRGQQHQPVTLLRKATRPATSPATAVTTAMAYPPRSLRLGRWALAAFGSPYVSGLSISRKKALSPP